MTPDPTTNNSNTTDAVPTRPDGGRIREKSRRRRRRSISSAAASADVRGEDSNGTTDDTQQQEILLMQSNVGTVTIMYTMFSSAEAFNGDLSRWDVRSVIDRVGYSLVPNVYHILASLLT